jgi:hypothetical protein
VEILNEGHKLGIIGGSDNHHGKPDISAVPSRFTNMHYPGGVAAVCCESLSRDDIFTALKTRSVYATTGERIILRFSINGAEMGQVYNPEKGEELNITVFAGGTADIRRIDIIKNGELFSVHEASGYLEELQYTDVFNDAAYYYIRLLQTDGAMAWSSPIWVE